MYNILYIRLSPYQIKVDDCDEIPHQKMDEKYKLIISRSEIKISAATEWGILNGLETLGLAHIRFYIFNFRFTSY